MNAAKRTELVELACEKVIRIYKERHKPIVETIVFNFPTFEYKEKVEIIVQEVCEEMGIKPESVKQIFTK